MEQERFGDRNVNVQWSKRCLYWETHEHINTFCEQKVELF